MADSFLDRTAADLLDLFAAGKNTPGAGSAAALAGALAGSLLQAVARYTIRAAGKRDAEDPFLGRAEILLEDVRERSRRLSEAVDEDAAAFERFWRSRSEGDIQEAIEVPINIAEQCAELGEIGIELYDHGFKAAQGEASTAVLLALAGGEAAVHVARLNLEFAGIVLEDLRQEKLRLLDRQLDALRTLIAGRLPGRELRER
jgi:methenyltetrahydrofolate cyclohydrolase